MKTILFQGDSITDVGRSREDNSVVGYGYPALVKGELGFEQPGSFDFLNRGIAGNGIVDLYARIKIDIINLKPDIMSILIGFNDAWNELDGKHNGVDAEKYFMIYSLLIEEIKEALPDVKIMILEPFALKTGITEKEWDVLSVEVHKRAEKAKAIAEKYNLMFIPLQDKFNQAITMMPAAYWLRDGVHPTTMGHELIKREWIKGFKKIQ